MGDRHVCWSLLLLVLFCSCGSSDHTETTSPPPLPRSVSEEGFVELFDGKTLAGWRRHEGVPQEYVGGKWEVIEGALVGDQEPEGVGGFLITEEKFRDFILRLETNLDFPSDSGVFLRMGEDGKSHQVTLDNRSDGDFGAIYLPWTQGMVLENPEGEKVFRQGEWNQVEIRIQGEPARIQVWINGTAVTDFQHTEETTRGVPPEGYIGLQVHAGGWETGNKVRFRNLRIRPL